MKYLEEIYSSMEATRNPWLEAARHFAALTAPTVMPQHGQADPMNRVIPSSSLAALGVVTLASKLSLEMLPPNRAFFRMILKPEVEAELKEATLDPNESAAKTANEIYQQVQHSLVELENRVVTEVGRGTLRAAVHSTFIQLVVCGGAVLYVPERGDVTVFDLRQYVTERDPSGRPVMTVIREDLNAEDLTDAQRAVWDGETVNANPEVGAPYVATEIVPLYTGIQWKGGKYHVWQELSGQELEGSRGEFDEHECPYLVLRWSHQIGEHYGPGYVWDFEGALRFVHGLTQSVKDSAALAARSIIGVSTAAPPHLERKLKNAKNGSVHRFDPNHVHFVRADKGDDLAVSYQALQEARQELRAAFLMHSVRDAERVTAFELRQNSAELQTTLGGTYANFGPALQRPLLTRMLRRMKASGALKGLDDALTETEPVIITGVDAIGRNGELNNLLAFAETYRAAVGVQADSYLDPHEWAERIAAATSVNPKGLVKSPKSIQDEQNQAALRAGGERAAPEIVKGLSPGESS